MKEVKSHISTVFPDFWAEGAVAAADAAWRVALVEGRFTQIIVLQRLVLVGLRYRKLTKVSVRFSYGPINCLQRSYRY